MDCINMPEIGYGNFRKKWLRKATTYSFKNCSLILPVADALIKQNYTYDSRISPKQGLLNLIPDLQTPVQVIPNGFDTEFWRDIGKTKEPLSFISVATGTSNPSRAIVKGYDLIEELAKNHPEWSFTLIGDSNYKSSLPNIKVFGKMKAQDLVEAYNTHRYYLQLSTSEGFPNSLGEAMACGCIPIGSAVGAIPEIIDSTGLILPQKDLALLQDLLSQFLLENPKEKSILARKRILDFFSYQLRQEKLTKALIEDKTVT